MRKHASNVQWNVTVELWFDCPSCGTSISFTSDDNNDNHDVKCYTCDKVTSVFVDFGYGLGENDPELFIESEGE